MQLQDFLYKLPPSLIAQAPIFPRDSARLMLINRQTSQITHHHISDLPALLPPEYFVVANNTKVFPARLLGHKSTGGKVEILLTSPLGHSSYRCISKPGLKVGNVVRFEGSDLQGIIQSQPSRGRSDPTGYERTIKFNQEESVLRTTLSQIGAIPTPPYIKKLLANLSDYQTIYAKYGFSAAAPTAGLHFTPELLKQLKQNHSWHELTLNVGLGTFLPVKVSNIQDHAMHSESYTISPHTATSINSLKKQGSVPCKKLLAIGTTTMRALESNVTLTTDSRINGPACAGMFTDSRLVLGSYSTNIFIYPPYQFRQVDALLTNFHLPGSTLLMLVSAFCSAPNTSTQFTTFADSLLGHAYAEAIIHNYRFFSFGDAMLII